jgi:hypothetical protein
VPRLRPVAVPDGPAFCRNGRTGAAETFDYRREYVGKVVVGEPVVE